MITEDVKQQAEKALATSINRRRESLNQNVVIIEPMHVAHLITGEPLIRPKCVLQINGKPVDLHFQPNSNRWERS